MTVEGNQRTHLRSEALALMGELKRNPDAATLLKIDEWTDRSPEHLHVFSELAEAVNDLRYTGAERLVSERHAPRVVPNGIPTWVGWAAVLTMVLVLGSFGMWYLKWPTEPTEHYRTSAASREFTLDDGSKAYLWPNSRIEVRMGSTDRIARLEGGSVSMDVQQDPQRPFFVLTGNTRVEALGTQFNVLLWKNRTSVFLEEGKLKVSSTGNDEFVMLDSGQFTQVLEDGHVDGVSTVWTSPAMGSHRILHKFKDTTLLEIAEHFNALNSGARLDVRGSAALRRFTAVLDLTDPQALVERLGEDAGFKVDRNASFVTITAR